MISNDNQLNQALEQIKHLTRALVALRKEILPLNRTHFLLLAEGPWDEIRRLRQQIDSYTGSDIVDEIKLVRDKYFRLKAEKGSLDDLLESIPEDNVLDRKSLEERRQEIEKQLALSRFMLNPTTSSDK